VTLLNLCEFFGDDFETFELVGPGFEGCVLLFDLYFEVYVEVAG
jgi:hypothetical protein